jgi:hypothetical protein
MRIYRISNRGQTTRGGPPAWRLGQVLVTPHLINWSSYLCLGPGPILRYDLNNVKGILRFGTWNARSLYRSGSLATVIREVARYKLYLVGVQKVRWDKGGPVRAGDYIFFYGKGNENHQFGTVFCTPLLASFCLLFVFLFYFLLTLLMFLIFLLCLFLYIVFVI